VNAQPKARKKPVRRVVGRVRNVEVDGQERLLTFELTKEGLLVHPSNLRRDKDTLVPFGRLADWGGTRRAGHVFTMVSGGLEVRRVGSKARRLLTWDALANQAQDQPYLFSEMAVEERKARA